MLDKYDVVPGKLVDHVNGHDIYEATFQKTGYLVKIKDMALESFCNIEEDDSTVNSALEAAKEWCQN